MYPKELEMTITVTQHDIDQGEPADPAHCPIACALRRRFDCYVAVGSGSFSIQGFWGRWPRHVQDFVLRFDSGEAVTPFSFRLPKLHPRAWLKRQWQEKNRPEPAPSKAEIDAFLDFLCAADDAKLASLPASNDHP